MKLRIIGMVLLTAMNIIPANASDLLGKILHDGTHHASIKRLDITPSPGCDDVKLVLEKSAGQTVIMPFSVGNQEGINFDRIEIPVKNIGSDAKGAFYTKAVTEKNESATLEVYLAGCDQKSVVEYFLVGPMPSLDIKFIVKVKP